jgi:rhamnose utilization protein RhaD (predicted bifunctional aldolase and dehydrogenase)
MTNQAVSDLIARSNRLGADPRNTNYAGGNTSAKASETDPVTGENVELLWVKGSGGDLGTLTESGLAVLRLDRLRALPAVYPGEDREDEMVAAFDYCLHGKGGAAPSIDTAMHALVDASHVDHLHPDSGIAFATAADGERLTKDAFGGRVVWVPWRRPGFQLGLDIAAVKRDNPEAIGCILGGHGITAWGATSEEAEANSLWIIRTASEYIAEHGRTEPFGTIKPGYEALEAGERRAKAAALAPVLRGLASTDHPVVGHFTDDDAVLDFTARDEHPRLAEPAAPTTSCAPRSSHSCSTCLPMPPSRIRSRACVSCMSSIAPTTRRITNAEPRPRGHAAKSRPRCAVRIPPSFSSPESACSATAPTSRRPEWRASSTSTRST